MIDPSSAWFNNVVAQLGHFGWGALFVAIGLIFFRKRWHWFIGIALMLAWVLPKEWIFDTFVEGAGFWNNFLDMSMYFAGAALFWFLARKYGKAIQ